MRESLVCFSATSRGDVRAQSIGLSGDARNGLLTNVLYGGIISA